LSVPFAGQLLAQLGEVFRVNLVDEPALAEVLDEQSARGLVVLSSAVGQLAGIDACLLSIEVFVGHFLDSCTFRVCARFASRAQGVLLFQVVVEYSFPTIVPRSEAMKLPANLFRPTLRSVREEREIGVWLGGLAG
jgi:hypothetical protein